MKHSHRLIKIFEETCFIGERIKRRSRLIEDLGIDSIDMIYLIQNIEKEFNIQIKESELIELKTFNDVLCLLLKKQIEKISIPVKIRHITSHNRAM